MFLHLDTQHLDILHLDVSSHLNVLQAFASQLAAQSLCQLVAKVSRAPLQKEEKQNCKSSGTLLLGAIVLIGMKYEL